jgi:hypothetical protein
VAGSRQSRPTLQANHGGIAAARTPGPLGVNDYADPNVRAYIGDTPGPVGLNDAADPEPHRPSHHDRGLSVILLDRARVARFLRSVAYVQATAELVHTQKRGLGLGFSATEVDLGDEPVKEKIVNSKVAGLMQQFAEACSRGSRPAIEFLHTQEKLRDRAAVVMRQVVSEAGASNRATVKVLEHWEAGLKTTEYAAGMVVTVAGLFVPASAALLAGIIGFCYDRATDIIDDYNKARLVDADLLALMAADVGKSSVTEAFKKKSEEILAGEDLEAIETLEKKVAHLHEKIAVKEAMIAKTSSLHNIGRLSRSIGKNEAEIGRHARAIGRFHAFTFLFAASDLLEKGKKIKDVWYSE